MNERILTYIRSELLDRDDLELDAEDDLLGSGLISSLAIFRLIAFLEETFGIRVPPEEMTIDNFMNVRAIGNFVRERQEVREA
jgi:acyl carrier protein